MLQINPVTKYKRKIRCQPAEEGLGFFSSVPLFYFYFFTIVSLFKFELFLGKVFFVAGVFWWEITI